ncbi:MAG: hypothetical protein ACREGA_02010 [Candidatus Saccharimonadales bacterium]
MAGLTAFMFSVGVSVYAYTKILKSNGNPRNSVIGAAVVGVACLLISYTILRALLG